MHRSKPSIIEEVSTLWALFCPSSHCPYLCVDKSQQVQQSQDFPRTVSPESLKILQFSACKAAYIASILPNPTGSSGGFWRIEALRCVNDLGRLGFSQWKRRIRIRYFQMHFHPNKARKPVEGLRSEGEREKLQEGIWHSICDPKRSKKMYLTNKHPAQKLI